MYLQNKYIQIHKNQSVAINLMKVSKFDLVKPLILYTLHFANKNILSSEIIIGYNQNIICLHCIVMAVI